MTVTIMIEGNLEFCDANNLVRVEVEPCLCVGHDPESPTASRPGCHYCSGSGEWVERTYPFEMNVANGNFSTLWNALGLATNDDDMWGGSIEAETVQRALACMDHALVQRAPRHVLRGEHNCEIIEAGIDDARANSYVSRLSLIVGEAIKRNKKICWG